LTVYSLHHCEGCARLKEIKSMTYTKDNTAKLQTIIAEGKAIVESLEASKRELQRRARERAVQIRRYQIAEEL